jgi:hypothetical protein
MEHCKIYKNRMTVYEDIKTLKIGGKCIKGCQIISNSVNDCIISTAIRFNDGKQYKKIGY